MKVLRLVSAMVLVVLLAFSSLAMADVSIPAPFESAKTLAMKTAQNANGEYILFLPSSVSTEMGIEYILGYLPKEGIIGVGMTDGMNVVVFMYCEKDQSYSVFYNGNVIPEEEAKVITYAFEIFRKMVAGQAI